MEHFKQPQRLWFVREEIYLRWRELKFPGAGAIADPTNEVPDTPESKALSKEYGRITRIFHDMGYSRW